MRALEVDWHKLLVPTVSLVELIVRGSVMFLLIFIALRLFRREAGALSTIDLLVVVLVADAAQNGMASEYHSITEGVVLVATIFGWNYLLDFLGFRFRWIRRVLQPRPLLLIKEGRVQPRNLRSEMLTVGDLKEQLREQGVMSIRDVQRCFLEGDGHLSVIRRKRDADMPPSRKTVAL